MYVWWYTARFGYSEKEKAATKDWLGRSLVPLIHGLPFKSECTRIEQYTEFGADASVAVVDDKYWEEMIELDNICTV